MRQTPSDFSKGATNMRRFFIALQVVLVTAAVLGGAAAGYALRPASIITVVAPASAPIDGCLFAHGRKLGC
jgi:hypothetical protein